MILLLASVLALFAGPLLLRMLGPSSQALNVVDGFVIVALAGLIGLHLLPESIAAAGGWAALATLVGLAAMPLLERGYPRDESTSKKTILAFALGGLAVHGMLDGAALALELELGDPHHVGHVHHEPGLLAAAVLFHRIPVGLAIWWLVGGKGKQRRATAILLLIAVATIVGFTGSRPLFALVSERTLAIVQALVAGMLIHAVFSHPPRLEHAHTKRGRSWAAAGAVLAVGALAIMVEAHPMVHRAENELAARHTFFVLALEAAPALVLAFVGASLIVTFISPPSQRSLGRGSAWARAARGMLFGMPLPICACAVVPRYKTLVRAGVPAAATMAFLVATPATGLDAVLVSFPLLGTHLAVARVVCAAIVALFVGVALGSRIPKKAESTSPTSETDTADEPLAARLQRGLAFGLGELFDHVAPWVVAGLFLASLLEPLVDTNWLAQLPATIEVPLFATLGIPLYVCASGATPLVAILMHKGLSAGAAIAFLLTGPATNLVTFRVLSALHGKRVALAFGAFVTALAVVIGYLVNLWLPAVELPLHELAATQASPLNTVCLGLLVTMLAVSLLRQGPRGFIDQLQPFDEHEHDHGDHPHHHHAHG